LKRPINDTHFGLRDFYYWNADAIQYNNPKIQIVRFTETNPIPFIRCWLENGDDVLFDCDGKTNEQIMNQLIKILGKSSKDIEQEKIKNLEASKENPAIFGFGKDRFCICEIDGQVPCRMYSFILLIVILNCV
jgi:small subunit ribosomal protein S25